MSQTDRRDEAASSQPAPAEAASSEPAPPAEPAPPGPGGAGYETGGWRLVLLVAAFALAGVAWGWPILLVIIGVVVMIFLHELGHFLTAKWSGMKVTEFFIGFGPKIWSFRRGEVEYGLKVVPAGAYVRIVGMNNLDPVDPADEPRTYRQQSFPKRLLVVSAGSLMHFLQAWIIMFVLIAVVGVPGGSIFSAPDEREARETPVWEIDEIVEGSSAATAGLEPGDKVVAFDGDEVDTYGDLVGHILRTEVGQDVRLVVERDGQREAVDVEIGPRPPGAAADEADEGTPFLGVGPRLEVPRERANPVSALGQASGDTVRFTGEAGRALVGFFSPSGLGDFASNVGEGRPSSGEEGTRLSEGGSDGNRLLSIVGAVRIGGQLTEIGPEGFLQFFLMINVFIGIFNMVPLLPFDGGHAAVAIYERLRSRPRRGVRYHADVAKLLPLTYTVVMGLVLLFVTALYLDLINPPNL